MLLDVYKKYPIVPERAQGKYIYDKNGKRYLDLVSGISVTILGHRHPAVIRAIKKQLNKYLHISNLFHIKVQEEYARLLVEKTFKGAVFFSNSGAEANELAVKTARFFGADSNRYKFIAFENSFHGRTLATVCLTGQKKFKKGLSPLLEGFEFAELNNINSVKKLITSRTVAVFLELVQGEGGIYPADINFVRNLRKITKEKNILLILDEIQTGFGRCGKLFAFQKYGITPDIMTLGKAAGGGLPLGVTILKKGLVKYLPKGSHGSTFGGNPISVVAGMETLKLLDEKMLERVNRLSEKFIQGLHQLWEKNKIIEDVRASGLMIGVEFEKEIAEKIVFEFLKRGIITNAVKPNILRFLPPYTITYSDIEKVLAIFSKILKHIK